MRNHFDNSYIRAASAVPLVLIIAPFVVILLSSFNDSRYLTFPPPGYSLRWYGELLTDPSWAAAFQTSALVGGCSAMGAVALSLCAALALNMFNIPYGAIWGSVIVAPLFVPSIAYAVGLYFVFAQWGVLDTQLALVLSHTALSMPICFLTINSTLQQRGRSDELAALTLGASYFTTFRCVTLPNIWHSIAVAFVFGFIMSFDEPVIALFIAGTRVITLPKKMWDGITFEVNPTIAAVSVLLALGSMVIVLVSSLLQRRAPSLIVP